MNVFKTTVGLIRQVANPKNYVPFESNQNVTEMPDTLILDNSGRVKVDYGNEEVRRRVHQVLSELREFQTTDAAGLNRQNQE